MAAPPAADDSSYWAFDYELLDDLPPVEPCFQLVGPPNALPPSASLRSQFVRVKSGGAFIDKILTELDHSYPNPDCVKNFGSRKRLRSSACGASDSKAYKEKIRRDRLNERHIPFFSLTFYSNPRFQELSSILEPGRPPKMDKGLILGDAIRMVTRLREEAQRLKISNGDLQGKVNELKTEKNELRDEKMMLKAEKDRLEKQMKEVTNARPGVLPHFPQFLPPHKLVPVMGFSGIPMWQMMPPTAVDTSEDHTLRPPVA
ncbi:basic helix-loop-helix (bHLH) DNA-bindingsuperfamily protein [Striga asiatica]|uniref:Basic helix-loop-helix (BHLH) DNA-bindingsuperfamily protein n=1 Tax=Striga asiatica TaxID=4170 RepID=A0A5A7RGI4_STRAF|nr:basic helix-loop-helix (bHLH) DNA-bindingsuperfamily protein [Striga asiatica]